MLAWTHTFTLVYHSHIHISVCAGVMYVKTIDEPERRSNDTSNVVRCVLLKTIPNCTEIYKRSQQQCWFKIQIIFKICCDVHEATYLLFIAYIYIFICKLNWIHFDFFSMYHKHIVGNYNRSLQIPDCRSISILYIFIQFEQPLYGNSSVVWRAWLRHI